MQTSLPLFISPILLLGRGLVGRLATAVAAAAATRVAAAAVFRGALGTPLLA